MATLVHLPTELLTRILHLSSEGESAEQQQRNRFTCTGKTSSLQSSLRNYTRHALSALLVRKFGGDERDRKSVV